MEAALGLVYGNERKHMTLMPNYADNEGFITGLQTYT